MYKDFAAKLSFEPVISYESNVNRNFITKEVLNFGNFDHFNKKFKSENIGFNVPSTDICHKCDNYNSHSNEKTNCDCDICYNYLTHSKNYKKARDLMDSDGVSAKHDPETIVVTGDMMRVIPIPILKTKSSNFYEKLMVYNQTFL